MMFNRRTGYLAAWIAGLALLFASMLPSVFHSSMARNATVISIPTEICTTSPVKPVVMVDLHKSGVPQDKHDAHGEECTYCRFQGDAPGMPTAIDLAAYQPLHLFPLPSLFHQSPRPLFVWTSGQPRAPPYRF